MQYAVFVYVSSAQAVIQDLFLFLFKTKDRERSEPNKPREKRAPFADTTLVRVTKPRFGSKYSGVLRSPQKLKMFWGPHSRALMAHSLLKGERKKSK